MKTYSEIIKYTVDRVDDNTLRYHEWPAVIVIAEAYGIDLKTVESDILVEKQNRILAEKDSTKARNRERHAQRRLESLALKQ